MKSILKNPQKYSIPMSEKSSRPGTGSNGSRATSFLRSNLLTILTFVSILFGLSFGFILRNFREDKWSQRELLYVKFGGEIFLRMLKALSLPLILSSVIAALGSLDLRTSSKLGWRTFLFYLVTTICAIFLGILLVITIHPGGHKTSDKLGAEKKVAQPSKILNGDVMMDMVRNMFPPNLIQATLYQYQTIWDLPNFDNLPDNLNKSEVPTKSRHIEGTNMLGLLVFSAAFGVALATLGSYGKPVLKLVHCLSSIFMVIANWVLWLAPIGIFCLLAGTVLEIKDLEETFQKSGLYVATVLLGLFIHGLVVLPAVYFLISGNHPYRLIGNCVQALCTAFGTSSSACTLPATVSCLEDKHGVDPRVARFVVPVGAAMNMDGTALYEAVAAFYLVQVHGISMDFGSIVAVSFIATISCIGISGIPHAGIVTMTMLLNVLGVPVDSIALLLSVDWILHRFRTTVNVLGDCLAAGLVDELSKEELGQMPVTKIISKNLATSNTSVEDV